MTAEAPPGEGVVALSAARPDSPELADAAGGRVSAYVHVPFCHRVCPYCDFAVVEGADHLVERYLAALVTEIAAEPDWRPLDAVFVGGGTPTRVPPSQLGAVLRALRVRFGLREGAELTVEANPEDWSPQLAAALAAEGFTRVSFGAQSFDPAVLARLGRWHRPEAAAAAVRVARQEGFRSVSLDLIFGTPGETLASWTATVEAALDLEPDHLSTYALTVERGTPLGRQVAAGAPAPDPDLQADMWEAGCERITAAGLVRYEVSNYARPGHPCRYNLGVWAQGEYLGIGAGAHGFRDGLRRRNVRRLDAYLQRVEAGMGPVQGTEPVEGWGAEVERLMLGLRRAAGVIAGPGGEALLASPGGRRLLDTGVIGVRGERLVVLRPLLTDEAVREVLSVES